MMTTTPNIHPILFSTPMVEANLQGRKTQTRRVVKIDDLEKEPDRFAFIGNSYTKEIDRPAIKLDDRIWYEWQLTNSNEACWVERCRWKKGDVLWVRETFCMGNSPDATTEYWVFKDGAQQYSTGEYYPGLKEYAPRAFDNIKWKPSIHMPKAACRLFLKVTNVRVERLQDVSGDDVLAEGVGCKFSSGARSMTSCGIDKELWNSRQQREFKELWQKINGNWDVNPWVWVIEYAKTEKPDGFGS